MEKGDVSQGANFQDAAQSRQQSRDIAASSSWVQPRVWHGSVSAMQDAHCTSTAYHAGIESTEDVNKVTQDTVDVVQEDHQSLQAVPSAA